MSTEHIVKSFDNDLHHVDEIVAEMGKLARDQIGDAITALVKRDLDKATWVVASDEAINRLKKELDELAIRLIALRQPMAGDLRLIVASLRVSSDLERVGDYAKNIAKHGLALSSLEQTGAEESILQMARVVRGMVDDAIDAFADRDSAKAERVRSWDKEVDDLNTELFGDLLRRMSEDPRLITAGSHMHFVSRSLERIGDHATNVAEDVIFLVEGQIPDDDREKHDDAPMVVLDG